MRNSNLYKILINARVNSNSVYCSGYVDFFSCIMLLEIIIFSTSKVVNSYVQSSDRKRMYLCNQIYSKIIRFLLLLISKNPTLWSHVWRELLSLSKVDKYSRSHPFARNNLLLYYLCYVILYHILLFHVSDFIPFYFILFYFRCRRC